MWPFSRRSLSYESAAVRHEARRRRAERFGGKYVEDMVLGANDGIITTFAVVAGATGGALSSSVIIILGFANLFADGVSMAASNYLGKRSMSDYVRTQRAMEEWEVEHLPEQETEEVRQIFRDRGYTGEHLDTIVDAVTKNRKAWIDIMMTMELGLGTNGSNPLKHGFATFIAFVLAGLVPLIPYLYSAGAGSFRLSIIFAALTLFTAGALRTLVTGVRWFRGGLEMLGVGLSAAIVAYLVGHIIRMVSS